MKKINHLFLTILAVVLFSCSGSETYRGDWKATDTEGNHLTINFEAKTFTIKPEDGEETKIEYSQNRVENSNGVNTYGISAGNGREYELVLPFAGESEGFIKGGGAVLYTISRADFVTQEDLYKLQ